MDIKDLLGIAGLLFPAILPAKTPDKPNFIIINCDDLGYGDLSCFGHPSIFTPNLDRMAIEGQKWTSFYVSAAVSSPSRAGLLTGRLGVRTGMYGNEKEVLFPDSPEGLPENERTIASLLKEAGYTSACVGKWHLGHTDKSMPWNHGFDYFYGIPFSNDMSRKEQQKTGNPNYRFELPFYNQQQVVELEPDQTLLTKRLTEYAVSFIEKEKEHPFFLYLAHPMPHVPLYASGEFQHKSLRGLYGDVVEEIDWSVG
ncbi:MAG: sulfatase-like hydrolase/transferase, partial [Dysgonamonadaceae bacterium]|nr:sulfatase-like hydrolase/transferase [Dysgonamonadaceae bacterium]